MLPTKHTKCTKDGVGGWPQRGAEGAKMEDRGQRTDEGRSFLTAAERESAEVVTLTGVARNEVEGD